ncbi:heavy metal-associated isoprenylated plant protein 1-like [Cornus florida]|uniref:heavy metal-associated isoprenylated plant protein 1-like n=1 Tax=Cornus florida TaxID=4283 RepID=UPI0028967C7E|nr:heavy metal-associated isoprenylated plant protein 1-like [Cornus florida]
MAFMGSLVGGAALGAVFGELLKVVVDVTDKTRKFKSELAGVRSTLNSVEAIVVDIVKLDGELNVVEEVTKKLTDLLREGNELVLKSSKIEGLKCFMRPFHSKKLIKYTDSLQKFFQINVQALLTRDIKKNRVLMNQIMAKLNEMSSSRKVKKVCDSKGKRRQQTVEIVVNVHCDGCPRRVKNAVKFRKGVKSVKAKRNQSRVTDSGNADPKKVFKTVESTAAANVRNVLPSRPKESISNIFSDENPNAC